MTAETTPAGAAAALRRFRFATVATEFVDVAAPGIVAALRAEAPIGKGVRKPGERRLVDSFRYARHSSTTNVELVVSNTAPQTRFVLGGTRPHEIHPKDVGINQPIGSGGHPLAFFWEKVGAQVASFGWHGSPYGFVNHPGTRADRFNLRAWEKIQAPVASNLGRMMAEGLFDG